MVHSILKGTFESMILTQVNAMCRENKKEIEIIQKKVRKYYHATIDIYVEHE